MKRIRIFYVRTDLWQIGAVIGTGMQIDTVGAPGDDLIHKYVRQLGGQRSFFGAREKTG